MSRLQELKDSFKRRLITAARAHLIGHVERSISGYEEAIDRRRKLVDLLSNRDELRTAGELQWDRDLDRDRDRDLDLDLDQQDSQVKEEPQIFRGEEDEQKPSQLHHSRTEDNKEPEPGPGESSETEVSDGDWEDGSAARSGVAVITAPGGGG